MIFSWPQIHGAVTHFPVALLLAAAFFEVLTHFTRRDARRKEWRVVSFWMLVVSVVMAVPSLASGYITGREVFGVGTPPQVFTWHWISAVATSVFASALLAWRLRVRDEFSASSRRIATGVLVLAACSVGYTGHLGGEMVFGDERVEEARDAVGGAKRDVEKIVNTQNNVSTRNAPDMKVDAKLVALGKEVYAEARCRNCHRIGEEGRTTGPDLTRVGKRLPDVEWHIKHLKNPQSVRPDSTMPSYEKLSQEKLRALSVYMVSLK